MLRTEEPVPAHESLVVGHRFGSWLEVEPVQDVVVPLENACLLEQSGATEDAIEILGEAIVENGSSAELFLARGALYCSSGFPRAASGDFQRATQLAPQRACAWYALGRAYSELSLARQALDALERAVLLGMDTTELHVELARTLRALARRGRAAHEFELALARGPETPCEVLVEAALLASDARDRAADVRVWTDFQEQGQERTDSAAFLKILLQESVGVPVETVAGFLRALDIDQAELERLTGHVLVALQLVDRETSRRAAERLLEHERDADRRAALQELIQSSEDRTARSTR